MCLWKLLLQRQVDSLKNVHEFSVPKIVDETIKAGRFIPLILKLLALDGVGAVIGFRNSGYGPVFPSD